METAGSEEASVNASAPEPIRWASYFRSGWPAACCVEIAHSWRRSREAESTVRTWPEEAEGPLRGEFPAPEVGLSRASYALSHKDDSWSSPHFNTMTFPIANVPCRKIVW
jgi:hypothetical protein